MGLGVREGGVGRCGEGKLTVQVSASQSWSFQMLTGSSQQ